MRNEKCGVVNEGVRDLERGRRSVWVVGCDISRSDVIPH